MWIDTHAHLYLEQFDEDIDRVVSQAVESGVQYIFQPAIDRASFDRMMGLQTRYPDVFYTMIGLHPSSVGADFEKELAFVEEQLFTPFPYLAIGEIGMDLYWDKTYEEQQKIAFTQQVRWAIEYDFPIAIHCRDAYAETLAIIEKEKTSNLRGVFHCFSGNESDAQRAVELGFKLGIGGVVTFKKSDLPQILSTIDLEQLILETDAPYLAPVPYRGKRNQSAYIPHIAQKLAEIYDVPLVKIQSATTDSALTLFDLK